MLLFRTIKNIVVPNTTRFRKVRFGICRGGILPLNLRNQLKLYFGIYEREISRVARQYAEESKIIYDIGSANGYYTLAFSLLSPKANVVGIEADKDLATLLHDAIKQNEHIESRVSILHYFVSDKVDHTANHISVDHLVGEMGYAPPDLIKMDIEGGEFAALQGALAVIREFRPRFIIETHSLELEQSCLEMLEKEEYNTAIIDQKSFLGQKETRPIDHNRWICAEARAK